MCWLCPFFATNEANNSDNIIPVLKAAQMYDKNAMTPEYKIDVKKEPEHYTHWYYDKDNPFQKKIAPVRTFIEFDKESNKIIHQL
jgi:hypothetical protein